MDVSRPFSIIESASAAARLEAAIAFLERFPPSHPVTVVAATRGAADDLARHVALRRGATIGLSRFSLTQLAARVAATQLAGKGIAPATQLGSEAVAARVAFDAAAAHSLTYFSAVASTPGFPRALAQTVGELRATGVDARRVSAAGEAGHDLAQLLGDANAEYDGAQTADRARLFEAAAQAAPGDEQVRGVLLLLDVALETPCEAQFASALVRSASHAFATVPAHDERALATLRAAGGVIESLDRADGSLLGAVRAHLFADAAPPERPLDSTLEFFSAPGEGRETVEIARRILAEAGRGVPFDEMAILMRAPQHYHGLLEHALERASVPAWFDRGTRRPHPAGRAFLALLACAAEGLSARRFAEYLSLGQLPAPDAGQTTWVPPGDEAAGQFDDQARLKPDTSEEAGRPEDDLVATLPAPRRWERMLVEAAVIGGDAARWERRLDGLQGEWARRLKELERNEPDSARTEGITRDMARLRQLRAFALPLIHELAGWPASAPWGDWLDRLSALAPRVLRVPAYVLRVLADLRPMASVGPVSLEEVRAVLSDRLRLVDSEPPARRYGRVFVGSPAQARGRSFRIVFIPGLAERMFPQKSKQDPLLGDTARARVNAQPGANAGSLLDSLETQLDTRAEQGRRERLLLHLAVGAATERLYVSYPRLEIAEGRGRVPSFYALDLLRGATGRIPDHEQLAAAAAGCGDPSLAWPAPADARQAIDEQEHDLSVLRSLLDAGDPASVRGHAQYILKQNAALRRSVTDRWARAEKRWTQYDGITRVTEITRPALAAQRLPARTYSLSALQRFAACPYQFLLSAIYRLQPSEPPQPLQRLDPLTKGSLVHAIQAEFLRELRRQERLPVTRASLDAALATLDASVRTVAAEFEEELVPAIRRVWQDELAGIARDLRAWVRHVADAEGGWIPRYFELAFGLPGDSGRDARSVPDPVTIDGRFTLRGAIDLVEEAADGGALRVTDHKTGKDRHTDALKIGGGEVLQPILYSAVVEQVLGTPVSESRLYFCTSAGGYKERPVRLTADAKRAGLEALEIIDRAIERGILPAAPRDGACDWCDFRPVCGPNEAVRTGRKPPEFLADLIELRSRP